MYKERITVGKVISNVFSSVGAVNIAKFVVAMIIPSLAFFILSICSVLIVTSAALMSGSSIVEVLLSVIAGLVVIVAVCIPLSVGIYSIVRKYQDTHEIIISNILICFKENMIKSIGLSFLLAIIIALGTILFVIPGIIFAVMFAFAFFVMLDNPELSILDIISLSTKLTKGYKLKIFGYNILIGIIPGLLVILFRGSAEGLVIYFIISLVVWALVFLGLSFFYMDSLETENSDK